MKFSPRTRWFLCSLITWIFLFVGIPVWAGEVGVAKSSAINIRKGPGTSYAVITQTKAGYAYPILQKSGDWVKAQLHNGQTGWIKKSLLVIRADNTGTVSRAGKQQIMITGKVVNVRSGPGTNFKILTKVELNEKYDLIDGKNGWYKIQVNKTQGWVTGDFAQAVPAAPPPPAPVPASSTPDPSLPYPPAVVVTGEIVNIRQAAHLEAQILTKVARGQRLEVLGKLGDWYQITLSDGRKGWIAGWLVESPEGAAPSRGVGTEVLMAPISTGKYFKIMDVLGRPSLVLEGWTEEQYRVQVDKSANTMTIEMDGATERNYEGKMERLGINSIKIFPRDNKAVVTLSFSFAPVENVTHDDSLLLTFIQVGAVQGKGLSGKVIVLDPGHGTIQPGGWLDPGALGKKTGLHEKDVNLSISLKLKSLLENAGAKVIMTHNGSTDLSLAQRAEIANNLGAHIFVSIHANYSIKNNISGHSTYYYAPVGDEILGSQRYSRQKLASLVQREMAAAGGRNNMGVLEENFAVLRETRVPSILVETAFLSDPQEEVMLGTDSFRQTLAQGIFNGIRAYFE